MSGFRLSVRSLLAALALVAIAALAFTLVSSAQGSGDGESASRPEKVTVVEEEELLLDSGPDATWYKRYAASHFVPYDDDMTYNYGNGGCVYRTGGTDWSEHTLQLPEGAEISFLRVYYYDNDSAHDAQAILFWFDNQGTATQIASVQSSGTPGWSSTGVSASHIVDNLNETLSLRLDYDGGTTNSLRICAVRIQYKHTLERSSLPLILNDTNP